MAQFIDRRVVAVVATMTLALVALLGGLAESSRAASSPTASQASLRSILRKFEKKLKTLDSSVSKLSRSLPRTYLTINNANNTFLKITDANSQFLKIGDANAQFLKTTDANRTYLPASAASSFMQGNGNVVTGALPSLTTTPQQLLSLPGGTIVVKVSDVPGPGRVVSIHNGTPNALAAVVDIGDGSGSTAKALNANADTNLPAVSAAAAEIRLQIFPGATFRSVVSILIGLNQPQAVAQAFTGGV
jgi:hypothetical protein